MSRHARKGLAAAEAGMSRWTGHKYRTAGKLPSQMRREHTWRTRKDPFEKDWSAVTEMLDDAPELEAKTIFEFLQDCHPGRYQDGQLRTLQRSIHRWRALHGPQKEIFFAQEHRPGEAMQTDFTWANEFGITIRGVPFEHQLCHPVLPYSNWEWVTVCRSESMAAIRKGVQNAVFQLGRVPKYNQTDSSSAATHQLGHGKRGYNEEYLALLRHLTMEARRTAVGKKNQNGDTEAAHRAFKARVKQYLLLRGNRDFDSVEAYEKWLQDIARKANRNRQKRLREELAVMRPLCVKRLAEYSEERVDVSRESTIRVKKNTYSVPPRLIDETVTVRAYDDRIEVYYDGKLQLRTDRLLGDKGHHVNYRHVIWWLLRKPGAFPRYRYREDLFPTLVFAQAYDALTAALSPRDADIEYLRVLYRAATTMESEVEAALQLLLDEAKLPTSDAVKAVISPAMPEVPDMPAFEVDLDCYNQLLDEVVGHEA